MRRNSHVSATLLIGLAHGLALILPRSREFMTSDDRLSLILRRLDEIERKLDHMLEELRTPTAIGYSARRGNRPRKD